MPGQPLSRPTFIPNAPTLAPPPTQQGVYPFQSQTQQAPQITKLMMFKYNTNLSVDIPAPSLAGNGYPLPPSPPKITSQIHPGAHHVA